MTNHELLIHFVRLRIESHSYDLKDYLDSFFWSNDLRDVCDPPEATITLRIERETSPYARQIAVPDGAVFAETTLLSDHCYYDQGCFYSINDGPYTMRLIFDINTSTLHASLGGRFLENDQWVIANLIKPFLHSFVMPFYGMRSLHGAALTKGERTVYLYGAGGAGKSTTTLGLMRAGWDLLSDDGPYFAFCGGQALAMSSLDYVHVTDNTVAMFPELAAHVTGDRDHREKFALLRRGVPHGTGPSDPRRVTHFLRLERNASADTPSAELLGKQAVAQQLINEGTVVFRQIVRAQPDPRFTEYSRFLMNLIGDISRNAGGYHLMFANHHLPELSDFIESLPMPETNA